MANELCRKHGISDATFYKWRANCGGLEVSGAHRLSALECEDAKLKSMLAEQMMDVATPEEMIGTQVVRLLPLRPTLFASYSLSISNQWRTMACSVICSASAFACFAI